MGVVHSRISHLPRHPGEAPQARRQRHLLVLIRRLLPMLQQAECPSHSLNLRPVNVILLRDNNSPQSGRLSHARPLSPKVDKPPLLRRLDLPLMVMTL